MRHAYISGSRALASRNAFCANSHGVELDYSYPLLIDNLISSLTIQLCEHQYLPSSVLRSHAGLHDLLDRVRLWGWG
jgi:hypothetical protein